MPEPYDAAGELTKLTTWIDALLEDEGSSRQYIAEQASAQVKDITLAMLGARELAAAAAAPVESEEQARALPAVRAVYAAFNADPGVEKMTPHNRRIIEDACAAAGAASLSGRMARELSGGSGRWPAGASLSGGSG
jgi:hypothetical protein